MNKIINICTKVFLVFYMLMSTHLTWRLITTSIIENIELTIFFVSTCILCIGSVLKVFSVQATKISILFLCSLTGVIVLTFVDDLAHYTYKLFN